jgi:hypothetical protein
MLYVFFHEKVVTIERKGCNAFSTSIAMRQYNMVNFFAQMYHTSMDVVERYLLQHTPFACAQVLSLQPSMHLIKTNTPLFGS